MNVIEIATLLSLDSSKITLLTKEDFAEMKAKAALEKLNPQELTDVMISQFFEALKKYPVQFQAVMENRALFNFFGQKNYPKKQFPEVTGILIKSEIKAFIKRYLIDEIHPFVFNKIDADDYQELSLLAEAFDLFPNEVSENMIFRAMEKLDLAIQTLQPPFGNFSKVLYVKDADFYHFLNGLKNEAIEEKVKALFTTVMNMHKADKNSEWAKWTFTAMKNYQALDGELSTNIAKLKESAELNYKPFAVNRTKYYWIYAVVGLIVLVRIWIFFGDVSEMNSQFDTYQNDDSYETSSEPRKLDRYYTDMKFKIDSFRVFLVGYNQDQIRRLTKITDIKTGQNPFETFYENQPTGDSSNNIRIKNSSDYDMLLLENAVLYDSIKIPRTAHFIKAGDYVYVNFNDADAKTIFNVYMGKKLATFQTESSHLFIRNGSVVEYRFSQLAPRAKLILAEDYIFKNDVDLRYIHGNLSVKQ
ncbi:hypothetical protein [Flavobacterium terrisoli]|uniref:hypothetical protein n=1 Tax=Flavobacterium terrisoli TaxID=3242195 RepID=UPI002542D836|nr:hypothetical protein [Flavobacterium buctense]